MQSFTIKTKNNKLRAEYFSKFIEKEKIKTDNHLFSKMCKKGCKNYGKKHSCPPSAPPFENLIRSYDGLFVIMLKCSLKEIKSTEYNKVRIANAAIKARIIRLMQHLKEQSNTSFLSTGACNLCKPCKLKIKKACAHPEKRRYSLEATGADCNALTKELFKIQLLWYKNKKAPEYTCTVCGLICNKKGVNKIKRKAEKWIKDYITVRIKKLN